MSQPDGLFSSVVVLLEKVNAADTSIPPGPDCLPSRIMTPPGEPLALDVLLDRLLYVAKEEERTGVTNLESATNEPAEPLQDVERAPEENMRKRRYSQISKFVSLMKG